MADLHKLNVVAQNRPGRPRKTWDEVLVNDRKKLGMILLALGVFLCGEDAFEEDLSNKPNPR